MAPNIDQEAHIALICFWVDDGFRHSSALLGDQLWSQFELLTSVDPASSGLVLINLTIKLCRSMERYEKLQWRHSHPWTNRDARLGLFLSILLTQKWYEECSHNQRIMTTRRVCCDRSHLYVMNAFRDASGISKMHTAGLDRSQGSALGGHK